MENAENFTKIGATHADGMLRIGFKELAQILPAFSDSVKPVDDPALFGNKLPMEVYRERHGHDFEMEQTHEHEHELQR